MYESLEDVDLSDEIVSAASTPKIVEGDEGKVENRSISELIAADKYLQKKKGKSVLFQKIVPGGAFE